MSGEATTAPTSPITIEDIPTVATLLLAGPSPIPPNEQVNGDLEDNCSRLYRSFAFVLGFPGTSLDLTITLADELDRALAASSG